jgi:hypothetical protein
MTAIMEYKLNENASDIVWLARKDDGIRVMLETDGWWKVTGNRELWKREPHDFYNNQTDVTDTPFGRLVLREWEAAASPTCECTDDPTGEYCSNMSWAPESVVAHYRRAIEVASEQTDSHYALGQSAGVIVLDD